MGINKVMYGSKTVIDLSGSTVAPDKMLKGIIGYNAAGEEVIGTHQCQAGIGTGAYVWAIYDTKEEWNYTTKSLTSTFFPDGYDSTTYVGWTITNDGYFELNKGTTSGDTYYLPEDSVGRKAKKILRKGRYSVINPYTVMTVKFTYKPLESRQYIEFRNGGMSGIFENFQLEDGATATVYSPYHKNTYPIPQAILNLDGYGDGVSDDVYNYVDWEEKKYHKRVGRVDLGSLTWTAGGKYGDYFRYNAPSFLISSLDSIGNTLCAKFNRALVGAEVEGYGFHGIELYLIIQTAKYSTNTEFAQAMQGVMLYYELTKEQIIDISDIIDNTFQEPIEVEAGGTLTFHNSNGDGYRLPIPNEEEYIVSLADIGGGASE